MVLAWPGLVWLGLAWLRTCRHYPYVHLECCERGGPEVVQNVRVIPKVHLVLSEQIEVEQVPLVTLRVPVVQRAVPRLPPLHLHLADLPLEILQDHLRAAVRLSEAEGGGAKGVLFNHTLSFPVPGAIGNVSCSWSRYVKEMFG